jgi:hypothetical protein
MSLSWANDTIRMLLETAHNYRHPGDSGRELEHGNGQAR